MSDFERLPILDADGEVLTRLWGDAVESGAPLTMLGFQRGLSPLGDFGHYVVLVCVQTDKMGLQPDYRPMYGALDALAGRILGMKSSCSSRAPPKDSVENRIPRSRSLPLRAS